MRGETGRDRSGGDDQHRIETQQKSGNYDENAKQWIKID
jgi:hypothetical protein